MSEKKDTLIQIMPDGTAQAVFPSVMNDMIVKKKNITEQIQECYEIMLDDASKFPNQFCVEFGVLKQMIVEL